MEGSVTEPAAAQGSEQLLLRQVGSLGRLLLPSCPGADGRLPKHLNTALDLDFLSFVESICPTARRVWSHLWYRLARAIA
jgi:hypothetical protein